MYWKNIKITLCIAAMYFIAVYAYSIVFGLPPFRKGFTIGYPAIYYEFPVRGVAAIEIQHGFTPMKNLIINIGIIIGISVVYILFKEKAFDRLRLTRK